MTNTPIPPKRLPAASRDADVFLFTLLYRVRGLYEIALSMVRHRLRGFQGFPGIDCRPAATERR